MDARPTHEALVELIAASGAPARVVEAFRAVRREGFVPEEYRRLAYKDEPIPIPRGQVTTQPTLIATMLGALPPMGADERALEVGTGYGFQTALLAKLCGRVYSVERFGELSRAAAGNLARAGIANCELVVGDGSLGLPEKAPFDAIVASAAADTVPPPWEAQLRDGGRLVVPLGPGGWEVVVVFEKRGGRLAESRRLTNACFVPLEGRYG